MVTDRKEGKPVDFEQNKAAIVQAFATELQKNVVNAERKTAKFDIKPIPKDLFPSEGPAGDAGAAAAKAPAPSPDSGKPKQ
jgi:peptidyl-prolyl cis-trans isomerase C